MFAVSADAGAPPGPTSVQDTLAFVDSIRDWFLTHSGELLSGLANIVLIIAVSLILRAVAGRVIDQVTRRMVTSHARLSQARSKMAGRVLSQPTASRAERQRQRANTIASVLKSVATFVVFGVAFVTILSQLGINVAPILASAGVVGLAVGFGAQRLVQDFLAGIFMMSEDQYGVGDTIDVGDAIGTVEAVTLRTTKIRDMNGGLWHVRNGEILRVCNMNQDWANAVVELPLDYSVDVEQAIEVIKGSVESIATDPDMETRTLDYPQVDGVVAIGGGATTVRVVVKTHPGEQWAVGRILRAQLKRGLDAAGIPVAHPMQMQTPSTAA